MVYQLKSLAAVFICCIFQHAIAQNPEAALQNLRNNYQFESIYVHYDKSAYISGETIWFKAYILAGGLPGNLSTSISVSLVNDSGRLINTKLLPVINSTATGEFNLDKGLPQGNYTILAYTRHLMNFGSAYYYSHALPVYNPSSRVKSMAEKDDEIIYFLPEGGNMIGGINNVIAFKSADRYGYPLHVEGDVVDSKGIVAASFESSHDGMGKFILKPIPGEKYTANVIFNHTVKQQASLPDTKVSGTGIQVLQGDKKIYLLVNREKLVNESVAPAYLLGVSHHEIVFKTEIPATQNSQVIIPSHNLPSGILQITLFTKDNRPLAERMVFIDNDDFHVKGTFSTEAVSLKPRGKNHYSYTVRDSFPGSFSVSVTDLHKDLPQDNKENLIAASLLTSEVKGFINNPGYYFTARDNKVKTDLDLVMMTSGWRRYNWDQALNNNLPAIRYKEEPYITIRGAAYNASNGKLLKETELIGLIGLKDSSKEFITVPVNAEGIFEIKGLLFEDTAKFYFQNADKNNKSTMVSLSPGIHSSFTQLPESLKGIKPLAEPTTDILSAIQSKYANVLAKDNNALLLQNVQLATARPKNKTREMEKKYITSGLFAGGAARTTFDFINEPPATNLSQNIFEFLKGRASSVTVSGSGGKYFLNYRGSMSLASGLLPMTIFLDEQEVSSEQASTIRVGDVAMVKIMGPGFIGSPGSAGAVAIYTKKGNDRAPSASDNMNSVNIAGYSPAKEFFSPDYTLHQSNAAEPDERTTIYWDPYLQTDEENKKLTIRFFNSDKATRLKVVLTGFTAEGKLLHFERVVE